MPDKIVSPTSSSDIAKQMSKAALELKAMAQMRHGASRPSLAGRRAVAVTFGKELLYALSTLPMGIMNRIQQMSSTLNPPGDTPGTSGTMTQGNNDSSDDGSSNNVKGPPSKPVSQDKEAQRILEANLHWQNLESRTKYLVSLIGNSIGKTTSANMIRNVDDFYSHTLQHMDTRSAAMEAGAMKLLAKVMKAYAHESLVVSRARETMALLGHNPSTRGQGIKILSIDGGGVRGLVAIEILRCIEESTGKRIYQLFDYICGVSTGSILAFLLGAKKKSLSDCEHMYKDLSGEIFSQSSFFGSANLVWNHAYYHTPTFEKLIKKHLGDTQLISLATDPDSPRVSAISTIVNKERVVPYVFRTYTYPPNVRSRYIGGCRYQMWEAVRASAAAPTYFEEVKLGGYLHQDGGILMNNPTSVALSEARTVWQSSPLQCVVSVGTGLTISGQTDNRGSSSTVQTSTVPSVDSLSWKGKFLKVLDSATDTENVHYTLNELLPQHIYFRFNPYLSEMVGLDEAKPEKLEQVQRETREYLRRNNLRVQYLCQNLTKSKGPMKRVTDWWSYTL